MLLLGFWQHSEICIWAFEVSQFIYFDRSWEEQVSLCTAFISRIHAILPALIIWWTPFLLPLLSQARILPACSFPTFFFLISREYVIISKLSELFGRRFFVPFQTEPNARPCFGVFVVEANWLLAAAGQTWEKTETAWSESASGSVSKILSVCQCVFFAQ